MAESVIERRIVAENVAWQEKAAQLQANIKSIQNDIKEDTQGDRDTIKELRADLKIAVFKVEQTRERMKEIAQSGEVRGTVTLDDFDVSEARIDFEMARGEYQQQKKEEKEKKKN